MKIPEKLKIGGLIYDVRYGKNLMRDSKCTGKSCGNRSEIVLDIDGSEQIISSTFLHEILGQLNYVYNIGLEHQQIYLLEAGLFQVMRENNLYFGTSEKKMMSFEQVVNCLNKGGVNGDEQD